MALLGDLLVKLEREAKDYERRAGKPVESITDKEWDQLFAEDAEREKQKNKEVDN